MKPLRSFCRLPAAAAWMVAAGLWLEPAPALAAEDAGLAGPAVALLVLLGVVLGAAGALLWGLRKIPDQVSSIRTGFARQCLTKIAEIRPESLGHPSYWLRCEV